MPKVWFWFWIALLTSLIVDAQLGHPVRAQPDAHGNVRQTEDAGAVGAGDALQFLQDIEVGIVVDEGRVVAVVR